MKIIKHNSELEVKVAAERLKRERDVFDTGISISFRVYDQHGNTLEFHVYYKKQKYA